MRNDYEFPKGNKPPFGVLAWLAVLFMFAILAGSLAFPAKAGLPRPASIAQILTINDYSIERPDRDQCRSRADLEKWFAIDAAAKNMPYLISWVEDGNMQAMIVLQKGAPIGVAVLFIDDCAEAGFFPIDLDEIKKLVGELAIDRLNLEGGPK